MRYLAFATDYDGTLALHGAVSKSTAAALERLRDSGRKLLLVTGRELDDLLRVFPDVQLFDSVVAENGALLYDPATREEQPLAEPPPPAFVQELERRGVAPLSAGRVIVATWEPNDPIVLQTIREMGLELQVIFNKGAVMVLPSGVNKAFGLRKALEALKLSPHNAVGIGDAENDHAFLSACECGVAVSNALDSVKARADLVTAADHGDGVVELIDRLIDTDLVELAPRLQRHDAIIGQTAAGEDLRLPAYDGVMLVAGPSGSGKTTVTTALLEAWCDASYQFCVVDPEGDYYEFPGAIALRGSDARALAEEALTVLERPAENAVVSLLDLGLAERPPFLQILLPRLLELRAQTGRPHWIVIDEAHHLLPLEWQSSRVILPDRLNNVVLVTVHPDHAAPSAIRLVDALIAVGREPQATVDAFSRARGGPPIGLPAAGESIESASHRKHAWLVRPGAAPVAFLSALASSDRRRHRRKYAEGELGEDRSFYFRGPDGRLNLRAQNLELFTQLAEGVDDGTWLYHLRQRDVSKWFREVIKDASLADEAAAVEANEGLSAADSRARIRDVIQRRYTTPA
jgi:hydroxymethylpyrimidine pyrophosphatase-like HAD family hydrolase/energy-coupling factor transporter ATP-binding protein EcfA2